MYTRKHTIRGVYKRNNVPASDFLNMYDGYGIHLHKIVTTENS